MEAEDRLSDMLESLQLRVLSSLDDTRQAVQTSVLSKSWVSLWTCIPVLNFSSYGFKDLDAFDNFVVNTLSHRRSGMKLDRLTFTRRERCSPNILEKVFDYAFSHGVQQLEADIASVPQRPGMWPILLQHTSSDSLTSLKLQSTFDMSCCFLQPRSGSFKNLTNLHLQKVLITDLDPFSGFQALDKLKLVCCDVVNTDGGSVLNVHALQLSEFTFFFFSFHKCVQSCEFTTPKLRYFEWGGNGFPQLKGKGKGKGKGKFPVLDTVVVNYNGYCQEIQEKILFDSLVMLFNTLHGARSLTVSAPVVQLLAFFQDELVNRCSSFQDLKLDFRSRHMIDPICKMYLCEEYLSETLKLVPDVKGYLLQKSHDAKCTMVNYQNAAASPCSTPSEKRW